MVRLASLGLLLLACSLPASAGAVPLPPTPNPLPGSDFQGANGTQTPDPGRTDWAPLQAAGGVTHAPDPNDADTEFADGSKTDEPGEWDLTTANGGVNPGKDNILDLWAAADQPDARTFLYLAFAREGHVEALTSPSS